MCMKIKENILAIAIALVFVFFIGYGINVFYNFPDVNDYCDIDYRKNISTQDLCEENEGRWNPHPEPLDGREGYCDVGYYCREEYNNIREIYLRNLFIITGAIGIITILASLKLTKEPVSVGFMGGGVLLILYGTIRYWGNLEDWARFIMLGVVLAFLIWIGYKKIEEVTRRK
jgi:hypothetical protein